MYKEDVGMYENGSIPPPMNDPYVNLAHAIVIKAVEDYRNALRRLKRDAHNRDAAIRKKECEQFFSSAWCKFLTDKVLRMPPYRFHAFVSEILPLFFR